MDRRWLVAALIVLLTGVTGGDMTAGSTSIDLSETTVVDDPQHASMVDRSVDTGVDDAIAGTRTDGSTAPHSRADDQNIIITQRLGLQPSDPGEISVLLVVQIPDRVESLEVGLPSETAVSDSDGFQSTGEGFYEWTGDDTTSTITYDVQANETVTGQGPERGSGTYLYAAVGSWALVSPRSPSLKYYHRAPDVSVERRLEVSGEGVASDSMAFLGPHETYTRQAHGQTFELIVPTAASMTSTPERILDAYATAAGELRVGDRDENVFIVAAPTNVDWAVRGLHSGDSDMWVEAAEPITAADNTWLHEYVHSRQRLNTTASSKWLREATATY